MPHPRYTRRYLKEVHGLLSNASSLQQEGIIAWPADATCSEILALLMPCDAISMSQPLLLRVSAGNDWPFDPPSVEFLSNISHPYESLQGGFVGLWGNEWSPACTIEMVLVVIQAAVSEPHSKGHSDCCKPFLLCGNSLSKLCTPDEFMPMVVSRLMDAELNDHWFRTHARLKSLVNLVRCSGWKIFKKSTGRLNEFSLFMQALRSRRKFGCSSRVAPIAWKQIADDLLHLLEAQRFAQQWKFRFQHHKDLGRIHKIQPYIMTMIVSFLGILDSDFSV